MRTILSILFISGVFALQAQDKLEPFRECTEKDGLCNMLYQQELWRLLNPDNAEWGVLRDIELTTEASLTYDAGTHSLVFTEIDGILWEIVRDATTERVETQQYICYKNLEEIKDYKAPGTKSISLAIPDNMAGKLKTLWLAAVNTPEENGLNILGGVTWTYFAGGKKAVANEEKKDGVRVPRLKKLTSSIIKAVQEQNDDMLLQLEPEVDELHRLFITGQ